MCITADYARGSSGGPVLNEQGAVVGMVCSTRTTYYGEKDKEKDNDVQMVVKFCIPADSIRLVLKQTPVPILKTAEKAEVLRALPIGPGPPRNGPVDPPVLPAPKAEPVAEEPAAGEE